jgi:hypothetical protein
MLQFQYFLTEAKDKVETGQASNEAAQTKGTIHELLVGRFLRGGSDMKKHPHQSGLSPKQALEEYRNRVTPEYYKECVKRAKAAADHIRSEVEKIAGKDAIADVNWTSKTGDLFRSTGIEASQTQDASDLVIALRRKNKSGKKFIGMSLKAGDGGGPIPSTNPGIESTFGGQKFVDAEHARLKKKYPAFGRLTNKGDRQDWLDKQSQRVRDDVYDGQTNVLSNIRENLFKHLKKMSPEERADWIRHTVLHAVETPMEKVGVGLQWKHSAIGLGGKYKLRSVKPSEDWEEIFNDPDNIIINKSGDLGIDFLYRDPMTGREIKFARHALKLNSRTGGMSGSVKGSGQETLEWFNSRPELKSSIEENKPKIEKPEPSDSYPGGDDWLSDAEQAVFRKERPAARVTAATNRAISKVAQKPAAKAGVISRMKDKVKGAISKAVRPQAQPVSAKGRQPAPAKSTKEKFDWAAIERDYTTTTASVAAIASKHGLNADDVTSHAWSKKLRRPQKRAAA